MQRLRDGQQLAIRLDAGEDLITKLVEVAKEEKVMAAFVTSGVGMLRGIKLGYFMGEGYSERIYEGPHELLSLQGSVAMADGKPHFHLHASLANRSDEVVGGHVFQATVHITCEILISIFEGKEFSRSSTIPRTLDLKPNH